MALRALDPAPTHPLGNGWDLVASEAGRSNKGLHGTVTLFNGVAKACQTLALGDPVAQQTLAATFAPLAGVDAHEVATALAQLSAAIEGVLRQMEGQQQAEDHPSQATILVALALSAKAELFHSPEGEGHATIQVEGHSETWPLKVKSFRRWLARLYYKEHHKTPGAQAVQDALGVLEGKALWDGPEYPVYTRLAEYNSAIYLDLGNAAWQAVEVTPSGWRVVDTPPVKFRRARGLLALPVPTAGGTLAALRTTPRDERDLVIAATNGWLIALDNLSHLPDWLSDALCASPPAAGLRPVSCTQTPKRRSSRRSVRWSSTALKKSLPEAIY